MGKRKDKALRTWGSGALWSLRRGFLQQFAHLPQQRLEAHAARLERGLLRAHDHGIVHEIAGEAHGLFERAIRHDAYRSPVPCSR